MSSTSNSTVLIFKCICNFIKELSDSFGKEQKSLLLYAHLIEKTGIIHEEPIKKHIQSFCYFVTVNEQAIMERDVSKLTEHVIRYSDKVYIDMEDVFRRADVEEKNVIWKHLITLLAIADPSSPAKKILMEEKERKEKSGGTANEEKFLSNIFDKVGSQIDPSTTNPADMMKNIMGSGIFNELVETMNTGLSNGDLDLNKMIGSLQSMMGSISSTIGESNPGMLEALSSFQKLTEN